ncbi:MAG: hypothetical protein RLZZ70_609 [Candidatus Parcubacteria bacterium]|jgi:hypothetical protein
MLKSKTLLSLAATIFLIFGSSSRAEDVRPRHLFIVTDQSHSMYMPAFSSIKLQVSGITDALTTYPIACGDITVTYFSWGGMVGPVHTTHLSDETSQVTLANFILEDARIDRGATNHPIAWQTVLDHYSPEFATVVIFLTNGSGYLRVLASHEDIQVIKVGVIFGSAQTYLENDFLPGEGELYQVHKSEELRDLLLETLTNLDTPCLG